MSYSFDYFVGTLRCPHCGSVSEPNTSTNMQTAIRSSPALAALGVGHPMVIRVGDPEDRGYYLSAAPPSAGPTRLLDTWECPACGAPHNWAEIVVFDGVIQHIQAVAFDRNTLDRAHYISRESISEAAALSGLSFGDLAGQDIIAVIRKHI